MITTSNLILKYGESSPVQSNKNLELWLFSTTAEGDIETIIDL